MASASAIKSRNRRLDGGPCWFTSGANLISWRTLSKDMFTADTRLSLVTSSWDDEEVEEEDVCRGGVERLVCILLGILDVVLVSSGSRRELSTRR